MSKDPVSASDARYVVRGPIAFGALAVKVNLKAFHSLSKDQRGKNVNDRLQGGIFTGLGWGNGFLVERVQKRASLPKKKENFGLIQPLSVAGVQQQQDRLQLLVALSEGEDRIRKDAGFKGLDPFQSLKK